jgi:hypothetical protein
MDFGILLTKYKWWMNGRPKLSLLGPLLWIVWAFFQRTVTTYFNPQHMGLKHTFFLHGLGFITHQTLTVDEWKAQNILTSSISYDILGVLIMDWVH